MRKLLAILSSFTIGASLTATLVSCNARIENTSIQFNKSKIKAIIAKIFGNEAYDQAWFDFGDIATDSSVSTILLDWINQAASLQYSYETTNSINSQLGISQYKDVVDYNNNSWEKTLNTVIENQLFSSYTTSITSNDRFDYSKIKSLYSLNVTQAVNNVESYGSDDKTSSTLNISSDDIDKNGTYFIWYKEKSTDDWKKWQIYHESGDEKANVTQLPTIEDLTYEYANGEHNFAVAPESGDDSTKPNDDLLNYVTSKTAVSLRFNDYFENSLKSSSYENALSMAYGKSNMYNIRKNADTDKYQAYINSASPMFGDTQSWKTSSTSKLSTNVKLVWSLKYKADSEGASDAAVNSVIEGLTKKDGASGTDPVIDSNGTLKSGASVSDVISAISKLGSATNTLSDGDDPDLDPSGGNVEFDSKSNSYDPYFGLRGYKGIAIYNGTTAIGTSPISGETYETNVENYNYRGGIVKYSPYYWYSTNTTDSSYHEVTIALPIYMVELLGGSSDSSVDGYSAYKLKGASNATNTDSLRDDDNKDDDSTTLNLGPTYASATSYADVWNYSINKDLHSFDTQTIAADETKRDSLLSDIQYTVAQDTSLTSLAKTVIYSKYIDPDDVYSSSLYDEIGKYIKSDEQDT